MATMSVRATYALDPETTQTIRRLAPDWGRALSGGAAGAKLGGGEAADLSDAQGTACGFRPAAGTFVEEGLKVDVIFAAVAVRADAEFMTFNVADFRPFVALGLKLIDAGA
ncbi:MAG: hypothetical protein AB7P02_26000 [Alphaproteobacteria bacterium]